MNEIVPVLLPLPLDAPFDYRWPDGQPPPPPGTFLQVPFGSREAIGVLWHEAAAQRAPAARLKTVRGPLDAPPLPPVLLRFVEEVARATVTPKGAVLRLAMSVTSALEPLPSRPAYGRGTADLPAKLPAPRKRVLEALASHKEPVLGSDLAKEARASAALLRKMTEDGILRLVELPEDLSVPVPDLERLGVTLTADQRDAASRLCALVERGTGVGLLDGVPGAGKTEVYFEAIAATLRLQRRVLVLLPEIALSAQWLDRFVRRFGVEPLVWHSALTPAQRRRGWRAIAAGEAHVVVGARSALFLPHTNLGLIVVDEEHDTSFKQEEGVIYHARDMALVRARLENCSAILASATPSLESLVAVGAVGEAEGQTEGWMHVILPSRHGHAPMPEVSLVDLRKDRPPRGCFLAPTLREALRGTVAAGDQALLFLNRRGYAPLTLCRACGHRLRCPNCSAWLTAHRFRSRLLCHHCGYGMPQPDHCPECGSVDSLAASGPGVERVAEEVQALLPRARLEVMTSDTTTSARAAERLVHAMSEHEIDILIGTQMIAKGHHFPELTLVGVVDADVSLAGGDPRAAERTFQLLYQVAGRAGRERVGGKVLIQTHLPDHPVMRALARADKDHFMAVELEERMAGGMPPAGQVAALVLSGRNADQVRGEARKLARSAPRDSAVTVLGPAPAPLSLLRGRWRERLLVKAELSLDLPAWISSWIALVKLPTQVALQVDIDPVSFL